MDDNNQQAVEEVKKKILLVEDDVDLQKLYRGKLSEEGFEIYSVATGESAISTMREVRPDLVILDIMLAGKLNGFDVLERMRSDEEYKKLPSIVFTNLDNQGEIAKKVGATDYIVKVNATPKMVLDRVKKELS